MNSGLDRIPVELYWSLADRKLSTHNLDKGPSGLRLVS